MKTATIEQIEGLSEAERALLIKALYALRYHRGLAWMNTCDAADDAGRRRPGLRHAGIDEIKHLARHLGGQALHWTQWKEPL